MTLENLDRELTRWHAAIETVAANVYELYEHPVYRALAGSATTPKAPLTGATRQKVDSALEAVSHLLICAAEIQGIVERAGKLRHSMPLVFREERIKEIEALLHGACIQTPALDIPLMQRGLLSGSSQTGQSFSIQQMLDAMTPAFESAKRTISEVEQAWATLHPVLDAATAEAAALRRVSEEAGLGDPPDLLDLQQRITAAREAVKLDPLSVALNVDTGITPLLAQTRDRLASLAAEQRQLKADLAEARGLQSQLEELSARTVGSRADRSLKIVLPEGATHFREPLPEGKVEESRQWLAQLERMMADPKTRQPVKVAVRRWLDSARRHLDHERSVLSEDQTLLDERLELRGRLDALVAKAAGCGLAEDSPLANDAQAARALLYRRPTPLVEARALVARYQMRLNERIASSSR